MNFWMLSSCIPGFWMIYKSFALWLGRLFFMGIFSCCIFASDGPIKNSEILASCSHPSSFTPIQQEVLLKSYEFAKDSRFKWILPAIAWQESCAGAYPINFNDPSAGVFHAHIPNVLKTYTNLKDTPLNRNILGQYLIANFDFAMKIALDQLNIWGRNNNLKDAIKSYNRGTSWRRDEKNNLSAERYYQQVWEKTQILENFIPLLVSKKQERELQVKENTSKSLKSEERSTVQPKKEIQFYLLRE